MMKICYDKKTAWEKEQIYSMYQSIFQDPEEFTDYYFQYMYPKNKVLKLIKEDRLASMIHLNPYTLIWNGEELPVSYIVAVATLNCYRRQGMMAALLKKALRDMRDQGELFTYLIPADEAYYRPFDFSFIMDWEEGAEEIPERMQVSPEETEVYSEEDRNSMYQICRISPAMYKEAAVYLNQVREKYFSLWIKADEEYVRQQDAEMKSENGGLYLIVKESEPEGFFACTMGENSLSCTNLWIPEKMTAKKLRSLLYQTFGKKELEYCLPGTACRKKDLKTKAVPKIMARIVNLFGILEKMRGRQKLSINLLVEDRFLPENEGCFTWELGPEKSRILCCEKEPEWKIGIGSLTELLFGYGCREEKLKEAPDRVKAFFEALEPLKDISITEQV